MSIKIGLLYSVGKEKKNKEQSPLRTRLREHSRTATISFHLPRRASRAPPRIIYALRRSPSRLSHQSPSPTGASQRKAWWRRLFVDPLRQPFLYVCVRVCGGFSSIPTMHLNMQRLLPSRGAADHPTHCIRRRQTFREASSSCGLSREPKCQR